MATFETHSSSPTPESALAALRNRIAGLQLMHAAIRLHDIARKAGFDPNQPRVPRGHPDGGQWTRTGGSSRVAAARNDGRILSDATPDNFWKPGARVAQDESDNDPNRVPKRRPATAKVRNAIIKSVAQWLVRETAKQASKRIAAVLEVLYATDWLKDALPYIEAYRDPPKSLEELRHAVSKPAPGYDIHHIVEKTPAEQDGFSRSQIEAPENLVRIPRLKHWLITGWYMRSNPAFGGSSPREFLRGKSWEIRLQVGLEVLVEHGVLLDETNQSSQHDR